MYAYHISYYTYHNTCPLPSWQKNSPWPRNMDSAASVRQLDVCGHNLLPGWGVGQDQAGLSSVQCSASLLCSRLTHVERSRSCQHVPHAHQSLQQPSQQFHSEGCSGSLGYVESVSYECPHDSISTRDAYCVFDLKIGAWISVQILWATAINPFQNILGVISWYGFTNSKLKCMGELINIGM